VSSSPLFNSVKTIGLSFIIFVTAGCYSIDNETLATSDFSSNLLKIEDISLSIPSDAKVYALGAEGDLSALDADTGELLE
jgi:hypothetical protein